MRTIKLIFFLFLFFISKNFYGYSVASVDSLTEKLSSALKMNNKKDACAIAHQLSVQLWLKGEVDSSLKYSQQTYDLALKTRDTVFQIKGLTNRAYNYHQKGNFELAIKDFEQAISLAKESGDTLQWANSLENLSNLYGATGLTDYPHAIDLLLNAAKLKEDAHAYTLLPGTYKNISAIFKEVSDTINREKYLLKAVGLVDQGKVMNPTFQAAVYNEAGRFYTDEKANNEKAESYFLKVLEISKQLNWKKGISASLSNMARCKELKKDYKNALQLLDSALIIKKEINDYYGIVNVYLSAGEINQKQMKYDQAISLFQRASVLASEKGMSGELNSCYHWLYKVYRDKGEYQTALNYLEKNSALSDSIAGVNHKKTIAELETKYQTEKKEKQIEKLTSEKQIETLKARQHTLIALILGALLLILILWGYFILRQKNLNNKKHESELNQKLLRSQMNPHFIFNALGTIQNYIYNNQAEEAGKYLAKFAKLMRNILESSIYELIPIDQEIETVTNYLTLQKMRNNNHFNFDVKITGSQQDELIPPMLAQPFIENSIKHAFSSESANNEISIQYIFNDDKISVVVEDNGKGINAASEHIGSSHQSHAIQLTRERLLLLNKQGKKAGKIDIIDLSEMGMKGTRVVIQI